MDLIPAFLILRSPFMHYTEPFLLTVNTHPEKHFYRSGHHRKPSRRTQIQLGSLTTWFISTRFYSIPLSDFPVMNPYQKNNFVSYIFPYTSGSKLSLVWKMQLGGHHLPIALLPGYAAATWSNPLNSGLVGPNRSIHGQIASASSTSLHQSIRFHFSCNVMWFMFT